MIWRILLVTALIMLPGITSAQVGVPIPTGSTVTVDAHGVCRDVTNPGSGTRMVFTETLPEWQSFVDHPEGSIMRRVLTHVSPERVGHREKAIGIGIGWRLPRTEQNWSLRYRMDRFTLRAIAGRHGPPGRVTGIGMMWPPRRTVSNWWRWCQLDGFILRAIAGRHGPPGRRNRYW